MNLSTARLRADRKEIPRWQFAVGSGILGWILDAFDFFVVIFLLNTLASHFHVSKADIVYTLTLTLAMRPVGAIIFGSLADRYGRRIPLILCVLFFSTVTILSGFAPSYTFFLLMRVLYGIGMGGYWGIGASYAMESAPRRWRGIVSGIMQSGYPLGYLLAAFAMQFVAPTLGWRYLFVVGSVITLLIVVFALLAPESKAWQMQLQPSLRKICGAFLRHMRVFAYLLLVMTVMSFLSHGTQDLYPDFLSSMPHLAERKIFGMHALFGLPVLYNLGAIAGAPFFGQISERLGRQHSIKLALMVSMLSIPAWAFGQSLVVLALGSCLMQIGVQGAFGVIPAHLNELAPDAVRSLFPGVVYQLGVLIASPAVSLEFLLRNRLGYPWALAGFEACVIVALLVIFSFGPERRGRDFLSSDP